MVNSHDVKGGAARAAYRLHKSLLSAGLDSYLLVHKKTGTDRSVITLEGKKNLIFGGLRPVFNGLPLRRYRSRKSQFSVSWLPSRGMLKAIESLNPDIVHLHWVGDDMLRLEEIGRIRQPLVWTLHDMWPFTGGCHYDQGCGRYRARCGRCPVLDSRREHDLSTRVQARKLKIYESLNELTVVGLSRWLSSCAAESRLMAGKRVVNLPNPIDTTLYKPVDKNTARGVLGIPPGKKVILFGALHATDDPRKGHRELVEALQKLETPDSEAFIFGAEHPGEVPPSAVPLQYLGHFSDDLSLRLLYSAADVTVVPSRQENLSNMIMESLACGTPVAAFAVGGNSDLVDHKASGYLAEPLDPASLARGIDWVLGHPAPQELATAALQQVHRKFEQGLVARRYQSLYQEILAG